MGTLGKLTGFLSTCVALMTSLTVHKVSPWKAMRLFETGDIWTAEQKALVHDRVSQYEPSPGNFRLILRDPMVERVDRKNIDHRPRGSKWKVSHSDLVGLNDLLGEDLANPLRAFTLDLLADPDLANQQIRDVVLNIRTERGLHARAGHSHGRLKEVAYVKTEDGDSTLYRPDGLSFSMNHTDMESVPEGQTVRLWTTYHASPRPMDEKNPDHRLVVLIGVGFGKVQ